MAGDKLLQFYRGLEAGRSSEVLAAGEPGWSTDGRRLYVGDGSTGGGLLVGPDRNFAFGHRASTRYGSATNFTVASGAAIPANILAFVPICVGKKTAFSELGFNVSTAGTGSARLGVYANGNGEPSNLIVDAGTVSVASTGVKTAAISQTLEADWYWLAAVFQNSGSSATCPNTTVSHPSLGTENTAAPAIRTGLIQVHAFGALPASASGLLFTTSALPLLFLGT